MDRLKVFYIILTDNVVMVSELRNQVSLEIPYFIGVLNAVLSSLSKTLRKIVDRLVEGGKSIKTYL
ncbi:MAG: hypothetical protein QXP57_03215 [Nitrososphaerota archaeon]